MLALHIQLEQVLRPVGALNRIKNIIANDPAERRRSAGEAEENSAARRMAYAKKFSIEL